MNGSAAEELCSAGSLYQVPITKTRNLGEAILMSAIDDYRSLDEGAHRDAEKFLYPTTAERTEHYEWVVGMSEGLNPAWVREGLDRSRAVWDGQRLEQQDRLGPRRRFRVLRAAFCRANGR